MNGEQDASKTAARINTENEAALNDWSDDRIKIVQEQLEKKYPDLTPTGAEVASTYDKAKQSEDVSMATQLALEAARDQAAKSEWDQDKLDAVENNIKKASRETVDQ